MTQEGETRQGCRWERPDLLSVLVKGLRVAGKSSLSVVMRGVHCRRGCEHGEDREEVIEGGGFIGERGGTKVEE